MRVQTALVGADNADVPEKDLEAVFRRVWDVPIEIAVEVARTMAPLGDTLRLQPGAIVPLSRLASEPVQVCAGGHVLALGEVVVIDEEFGVRITEVTGGGTAEDSPELHDAAVEPPVDGGGDPLADLAAWQAARGDA